MIMKDDERLLLLRSFDEDFGEMDQAQLTALLDHSTSAREERIRLRRMRDLLALGAEERFESGFADRVLAGVTPGISAGLTPGITPGITAADRPAIGRRRRGRYLAAPSPWRLAVGSAAAIAVLLAAAVIWWMQPRATSVPTGETAVVTLGDGTSVELSGGSTLSYRPFVGRSERRVELDGEAFFDVAAGERTFVVETFNAEVTVLGTAFNVRAWGADPDRSTEIVVSEGRVALAPFDPDPKRQRRDSASLEAMQELNNSRLVVLEAGQAASVADGTASSVEAAALDRVLAWRSGGLAFTDEHLDAVFRTVERRYGIRIEVADPAVNSRLLTYLNPRPSSAAAVLADICHTLDLRYRRTANGFEVLSIDSTARQDGAPSNE